MAPTLRLESQRLQSQYEEMLAAAEGPQPPAEVLQGSDDDARAALGELVQLCEVQADGVMQGFTMQSRRTGLRDLGAVLRANFSVPTALHVHLTVVSKSDPHKKLGHVFVIERAAPTLYQLYASYANAFFLFDWLEGSVSNFSKALTAGDMEEFIHVLERLERPDPQNSALWARLWGANEDCAEVGWVQTAKFFVRTATPLCSSTSQPPNANNDNCAESTIQQALSTPSATATATVAAGKGPSEHGQLAPSGEGEISWPAGSEAQSGGGSDLDSGSSAAGLMAQVEAMVAFVEPRLLLALQKTSA
eukprot:gnl/Hemi2/12767_TR4364_c0_g1_i1.p1 gnl/Hemi2/12767_TR4364_c0_g1~~gnl/Hemi2/12767_TR4364_c0_g1_i1.p1  ORF type:complete len:305 (-),score=90.42 gnl/Hemi2/12767_TR4364_c0_g1_i1:76-990(-)